jgi:hypothetical protein
MRGSAAGFKDVDRADNEDDDDDDEGDDDDTCTPTLWIDVGTIVKAETDEI